jgi:hypothetical protein
MPSTERFPLSGFAPEAASWAVPLGAAMGQALTIPYPSRKSVSVGTAALGLWSQMCQEATFLGSQWISDKVVYGTHWNNPE